MEKYLTMSVCELAHSYNKQDSTVPVIRTVYAIFLLVFGSNIIIIKEKVYFEVVFDFFLYFRGKRKVRNLKKIMCV